MRSGHSQSRRRQLINRGLLGTHVTEQSEAGSDLSAPEVRDAEEIDDSLPSETEEDIDRAVQALFSAGMPWPEIQAGSTPAAHSAAHSAAARVVDCDAGLAAIRSLLQCQQPVTWVFTGDNIVQGACYTNGARNCVEIFTERIRSELRRAGDVVINTGISGDTAAGVLESLKRRATRHDPEVVAISVGLNDAKQGPPGRVSFRREVREILDLVRTAGAIPLVILPHPVYLPGTPKRADLPQYVNILRDEIVRDEVPCVDQWTDWLRHWPDPCTTRARLADGRFQLGAAGHQHLAGLLFQTLGIFDPKSPACTGNNP